MIYYAFALGVSNGLLFTPPSEFVIWWILTNGGGNLELSCFILGNTIGHLLLFGVTKAFIRYLNGKDLVSYLRDTEKHIPLLAARCMGFLHEGRGYYVAYGRLLPFFHSFTSVIAAYHDVPVKKVIAHTFIGNVLFTLMLALGITYLNSAVGKWYTLVVVAIIAIGSHLLLKKIDARAQ